MRTRRKRHGHVLQLYDDLPLDDKLLSPSPFRKKLVVRFLGKSCSLPSVGVIVGSLLTVSVQLLAGQEVFIYSVIVVVRESSLPGRPRLRSQYSRLVHEAPYHN